MIEYRCDSCGAKTESALGLAVQQFFTTLNFKACNKDIRSRSYGGKSFGIDLCEQCRLIAIEVIGCSRIDELVLKEIKERNENATRSS